MNTVEEQLKEDREELSQEISDVVNLIRLWEDFSNQWGDCFEDYVFDDFKGYLKELLRKDEKLEKDLMEDTQQ